MCKRDIYKLFTKNKKKTENNSFELNFSSITDKEDNLYFYKKNFVCPLRSYYKLFSHYLSDNLGL